MAQRRASRTVNARIHRLTGQLTAIETMIQERRSCPEILQQLSAVRAGLETVAAIVFQTELEKQSATKRLTARDIESLTQLFIKTV